MTSNVYIYKVSLEVFCIRDSTQAKRKTGSKKKEMKKNNHCVTPELPLVFIVTLVVGRVAFLSAWGL